MKMYDKNGKLTIIAKMVFDQNMERLRAGDSPLEIAKTLHEQLKLVEYNGAFIDSSGKPTIWYWAAFRIGFHHWVWKMQPLVDTQQRFHLGATTGRMSQFGFDLKAIPGRGTLVP